MKLAILESRNQLLKNCLKGTTPLLNDDGMHTMSFETQRCCCVFFTLHDSVVLGTWRSIYQITHLRILPRKATVGKISK